MSIFLIYSSAEWVSEFKSGLHVTSDEMKHHRSDNEHALWLSCSYSAVKKSHIQKVLHVTATSMLHYSAVILFLDTRL